MLWTIDGYVISFCKSKNTEFVVAPAVTVRSASNFVLKNNVSQNWIGAWKPWYAVQISMSETQIRSIKYERGILEGEEMHEHCRRRLSSMLGWWWERDEEEYEEGSFNDCSLDASFIAYTQTTSWSVEGEHVRKICDAKQIERYQMNCFLNVSSMESTLLQVRLNFRGLDVN